MGMLKSTIKKLLSPFIRFMERRLENLYLRLHADISEKQLAIEESFARREEALFGRIDADLWQKQQAIEESLVRREEALFWRIDADLWQKQLAIEESLVRREEALFWRIDADLWQKQQAIEKKVLMNINRIGNTTNQLLINSIHSKNRMPYIQGEKIRIAILFYIPSAWASLETVYNLLAKDSRFDLHMLVYEGTHDKNVREKSGQIVGGIRFLESLNIPYEIADDYDFAKNKPHIVLYQSPWEKTQLPRYLRTSCLGLAGARIAYIPYGIEYAETDDITYRFSNIGFYVKAWRMYTISEAMFLEHKINSPAGFDFIRVTGHPKFDFLPNRQQFGLNKNISRAVENRKIILMLFHFPNEASATTIAAPVIEEYINFLSTAAKYNDLFFLLRPHPKFFYTYMELGEYEKLKKFKTIVSESANMAFDDELDYRFALCNADYAIGDRSALMVEVAAMNIPVLYMTNFFCQEGVLPAMKPLFDSYYQGNSSYDIDEFIKMVVINGDDYKKNDRVVAVEKCLPYLDGKCGERIVEDMAKSIYSEGQAGNQKCGKEETLA